jgi:hypothetical protein
MAIELSASQPWPGLAAYDEGARAYFQGRDAEAEALVRLIRMAPLTVLYSRSGLGKSSLLKAGVFPRLRAAGCLPVYLRLDFSTDAQQDPVDQIARRLAEEIATAGLDAPPRDPGESLWRWLHRKDFELWSADNRPWTPVLVFDQFEELFSRTGGDAARIAAVFETLADLAENRLEQEVADSRRGRDALDLITQRYRMLLSFREDFLPELRTWQTQVPSLLRNDLRLVAMTRNQAVGAVRRAGAAVLAPGVAEQLVDFVGALGSAPGAQTIEPALLSLCGAQLARRMPAGGRIDAALLAKAGADILQDFYRDALADMPDGVHCFIEDHLLQGDRTRGSYARAEALAQGFLTREQLARLTDEHRLLRVEQDSGVPRIELIHDRLVDVVRAARDRRAALRDAEAGREAERREAELQARQQAEAAAARLRRSQRWLATAFALALAMLGAALWQARQAGEARDEAVQARAVETIAKDAANQNAKLAEMRLRQTTELLRQQYGWVGDWPVGGNDIRVQQAVKADQVLRQKLAAPQSPSKSVATGGAEPVSRVRIEAFVKGVDEEKVNQALRELGYQIDRPPARVADKETNALWYGSAVPDEDIRVVALALMRAGVKLREIAPIRDTLSKRELPLIQVGASRRVAEAPVWTVDRLLLQPGFTR